MKVELWCIGKTKSKYLTPGMDEYVRRIDRYFPFRMVCLPGSKAKASGRMQSDEFARVQARIKTGDHLVLLDEGGSTYDSPGFADWLEGVLGKSRNRLVFLIGGPYGFSPEMYETADEMISLSKMTFPHDLIRLAFLEQLYRACTIMRKEPYHH